MNMRFIILMGIIFSIYNIQAMKNGENTITIKKNKKKDFIERLAQEHADWEKRKKNNSSANQGLDTLELEKVKKILEN